MKVWLAIFYAEFQQAWRACHQLLNSMVFFGLVAVLFGVVTSGQTETMAGMLWMAVLLASLTGLEHCLQREIVDDALYQLRLSPHSLTLLISAKLLAHYLIILLPLLLASALLVLGMGWSAAQVGIWLATVMLGLPIIYGVGALIASLTLGLQQRGLLLAVLLLPLILPVVIVSVGVLSANVEAQRGLLALLAAGCVVVCTSVPPAVGAVLRFEVD